MKDLADTDWADLDSHCCSIARTLETVGDHWSILVLRDVLNGIRRFDQLQRHLGVARNVLNRRLAALVEAQILTRVPYQEPGARQRYEYELTDRGRDLLPILAALMAWGDRHLAGKAGPPMLIEHAGCETHIRLVPMCGAGHVVSSADDIRLRPGPGARPVA